MLELVLKQVWTCANQGFWLVESYDDDIITDVLTASISSILEQVWTCTNQGFWLVESYDDDIIIDVSLTSDSSYKRQGVNKFICLSDTDRITS